MDPHYGFALNSRYSRFVFFWENHGLQNLSILTKLPQFLTRVYSTMLLEHTHTHMFDRFRLSMHAWWLNVMSILFELFCWFSVYIIRRVLLDGEILNLLRYRDSWILERRRNYIREWERIICPIKKLYTRIYIWRTECIIINRNGEESGAGRRITAGKKTFGNNGFIVAIGRAESPWTEGAVKDETRTFIGNFTWWNNEWNIANASQWYAARSVAGIVQRKKKGGRDGAPPPHCHCFLKGSDVKPCGEGR